MTGQFQARLDTYFMARRDLEAAALALPVLTPADVDLHAGHTMQIITEGLVQASRYDPAGQHGWTDGWDDLGDMEGPEYVICDCSSQAVFRVPTDVVWD